MLQEFRKFILRGNVLDLAVAVIMGASFGAIVNSLVNDVIMPPIGLILGRVDFSTLFINLSGTPYATLADAKKAGAATINYGLFLNSVISFLIVSLVVFLIVRQVNRFAPKPAPEPVAPATKECHFCTMAVPVKATRCPHCTSTLKT